jgi:hypothetical protein
MMGRQTGDQSQLFYLFNLERRIPAGHLLRRINPVVTRILGELREKLAPFYSEIGRPSIDPELMIRMLIVDQAALFYYIDRRDHGVVSHRPNREGSYYPGDPSGTNVRRDVYCPYSGPKHSCRSGLVDQLFNSSEKRLARMLLLLANFGKESKPEPIIANISQETLAEMIGTTRSRVSFFMNKFRVLGFIDYNGNGLEVHSSLLNAVLLDQPQIKI